MHGAALAFSNIRSIMNTKIFFTTNVGLYFYSETAEILVDGIHNAGSAGFSPMTDERRRQMESRQGFFAGAGALLFTHLHRDHYDDAAVRAYLSRHPETALWGPELRCKGFTDVESAGPECRFTYGDFNIIAYKTKHSGSSALNVPHYSLLLCRKSAGETFFVAGDAVLEPELADQIHEAAGGPDGIYAFVMAYQLAEKRSKSFIQRLSPSRIFLIHQPRAADEAYHTVSGIMRLALKETPDGVIVETPEPMSWVD